MRRCKDCGQLKSFDQFYTHTKRTGRQAGQTHYSSYCRRCDDRRTVVSRRRSKLRDRYGMGVTDYERMLVSQGGGCLICGEPNEAGREWLVIDHDHRTGKVRGLLCDRCNRVLGSVRDSKALLRRMISYLEKG